MSWSRNKNYAKQSILYRLFYWLKIIIYLIQIVANYYHQLIRQLNKHIIKKNNIILFATYSSAISWSKIVNTIISSVINNWSKFDA